MYVKAQDAIWSFGIPKASKLATIRVRRPLEKARVNASQQAELAHYCGLLAVQPPDCESLVLKSLKD